HAEEPFDPLRAAREQGNTLVQAFHERFADKRGVNAEILHDVVALANTNGGNIYVGASESARAAVVGVERTESAITDLRAATARQITPQLEVQIDILKSQGKNVLQVIVPRGSEAPYALDDAYIYVRSEGETNLAVRDELIQLVREAIALGTLAPTATAPASTAPGAVSETISPKVKPPRTGVEIASFEVKKGTKYFAVRDLRNARIVTNVTRASARKLWQYAIEEREKNPVDAHKVQWVGDIGIWKQHKHGGKMRYDLVQRAGEKIFVYYGVTEDGIHDQWRTLIAGEETGAMEMSAPELPADAQVNADLIAPMNEMEMPREMEDASEPRAEIAAEMIPPIDVAEDFTATAELETPAEMEMPPAQTETEIQTPANDLPPVIPNPSEPRPSDAQPKSTAQTWREELERAMKETNDRSRAD
ncbi:MAG: putative DNA binding domain-containing protein, partial [Chloroflexi bacterium]|nr:putative DNA binding domain-containing protein [Chloroflexota bacterium]